MLSWGKNKEILGDDPPYLPGGTEVSARYKGAFCEAKIKKINKSVKCKVEYKNGGSGIVSDDQIKGVLMTGASVEVKLTDKKEYTEAVIVKIQDLSQYTVLFDDGDLVTLRRTALCLKSGRHFADGPTLDHLPLTNPERFSNPVFGTTSRTRRSQNDKSSDEDTNKSEKRKIEKEKDMGKVVCVELSDKRKVKDNWFPALVVAPNAQETVRIDTNEEYLVRSFKDGRYYTVPKKETTEFTKETARKVENHTLKIAVEKAILFLDKDELPPHWDRDVLFGMIVCSSSDDLDGDSSDDEPREEKDHFVAQLYKFMDDRGTPINKELMISSRDVDVYKLYKVVARFGGFTRVTNKNQWKFVTSKLGFGANHTNNVRLIYKKYIHGFAEFYRKLGCTLLNNSRTNRPQSRSTRPLIRDRDKSTLISVDKPVEKEHSKEKDEHSRNKNDIERSSDEVSSRKESLRTKSLKTESSDTIKTEDSSSRHTQAKKKEEKLKLLEQEDPYGSPPILRDETKWDGNTIDTSDISPVAALSLEGIDVKPGVSYEVLEQRNIIAGSFIQGKKPLKRLQKSVNEHETSLKKLSVSNVKQSSNNKPPVSSVLSLINSKKKSFTDHARMNLNQLKSSSITGNTTTSVSCGNGVNAINVGVDTSDVSLQVNFNNAADFTFDKPIPGSKEKINDDTKTKIKSKEDIANKSMTLSSGVTSSGSSNIVNDSTDNNFNKNAAITVPLDGKSEEDKKKIIKKKKEEDVVPSSGRELIAISRIIHVGDKLKVYYGPTQDSTVTYEAKVMEIKRSSGGREYFVHYTGWNNRYDEWITRNRIADNLSRISTRGRKKLFKSDEAKQGKTKSDNEVTINYKVSAAISTKENVTTSTPIAPTATTTATTATIGGITLDRSTRSSSSSQVSTLNSKSLDLKEKDATRKLRTRDTKSPTPSYRSKKFPTVTGASSKKNNPIKEGDDAANEKADERKGGDYCNEEENEKRNKKEKKNEFQKKHNDGNSKNKLSVEAPLKNSIDTSDDKNAALVSDNNDDENRKSCEAKISIAENKDLSHRAKESSSPITTQFGVKTALSTDDDNLESGDGGRNSVQVRRKKLTKIRRDSGCITNFKHQRPTKTNFCPSSCKLTENTAHTNYRKLYGKKNSRRFNKVDTILLKSNSPCDSCVHDVNLFSKRIVQLPTFRKIGNDDDTKIGKDSSTIITNYRTITFDPTSSDGGSSDVISVGADFDDESNAVIIDKVETSAVRSTAIALNNDVITINNDSSVIAADISESVSKNTTEVDISKSISIEDKVKSYTEKDYLLKSKSLVKSQAINDITTVPGINLKSAIADVSYLIVDKRFTATTNKTVDKKLNSPIKSFPQQCKTDAKVVAPTKPNEVVSKSPLSSYLKPTIVSATTTNPTHISPPNTKGANLLLNSYLGVDRIECTLSPIKDSLNRRQDNKDVATATTISKTSPNKMTATISTTNDVIDADPLLKSNRKSNDDIYEFKEFEDAILNKSNISKNSPEILIKSPRRTVSGKLREEIGGTSTTIKLDKDVDVPDNQLQSSRLSSIDNNKKVEESTRCFDKNKITTTAASSIVETKSSDPLLSTYLLKDSIAFRAERKETVTIGLGCSQSTNTSDSRNDNYDISISQPTVDSCFVVKCEDTPDATTTQPRTKESEDAVNIIEEKTDDEILNNGGKFYYEHANNSKLNIAANDVTSVAANTAIPVSSVSLFSVGVFQNEQNVPRPAMASSVFTTAVNVSPITVTVASPIGVSLQKDIEKNAVSDIIPNESKIKNTGTLGAANNSLIETKIIEPFDQPVTSNNDRNKIDKVHSRGDVEKSTISVNDENSSSCPDNDNKLYDISSEITNVSPTESKKKTFSHYAIENPSVDSSTFISTSSLSDSPSNVFNIANSSSSSTSQLSSSFKTKSHYSKLCSSSASRHRPKSTDELLTSQLAIAEESTLNIKEPTCAKEDTTLSINLDEYEYSKMISLVDPYDKPKVEKNVEFSDASNKQDVRDFSDTELSSDCQYFSDEEQKLKKSSSITDEVNSFELNDTLQKVTTDVDELKETATIDNINLGSRDVQMLRDALELTNVFDQMTNTKSSLSPLIIVHNNINSENGKFDELVEKAGEIFAKIDDETKVFKEDDVTKKFDELDESCNNAFSENNAHSTKILETDNNTENGGDDEHVRISNDLFCKEAMPKSPNDGSTQDAIFSEIKEMEREVKKMLLNTEDYDRRSFVDTYNYRQAVTDATSAEQSPIKSSITSLSKVQKRQTTPERSSSPENFSEPGVGLPSPFIHQNRPKACHREKIVKVDKYPKKRVPEFNLEQEKCPKNVQEHLNEKTLDYGIFDDLDDNPTILEAETSGEDPQVISKMKVDVYKMKLNKLRSLYMMCKVKVGRVDKRLKKLRRKERIQKNQTNKNENVGCDDSNNEEDSTVISGIENGDNNEFNRDSSNIDKQGATESSSSSSSSPRGGNDTRANTIVVNSKRRKRKNSRSSLVDDVLRKKKNLTLSSPNNEDDDEDYFRYKSIKKNNDLSENIPRMRGNNSNNRYIRFDNNALSSNIQITFNSSRKNYNSCDKSDYKRGDIVSANPSGNIKNYDDTSDEDDDDDDEDDDDDNDDDVPDDNTNDDDDNDNDVVPDDNTTNDDDDEDDDDNSSSSSSSNSGSSSNSSSSSSSSGSSSDDDDDNVDNDDDSENSDNERDSEECWENSFFSNDKSKDEIVNDRKKTVARLRYVYDKLTTPARKKNPQIDDESQQNLDGFNVNSKRINEDEMKNRRKIPKIYYGC